MSETTPRPRRWRIVLALSLALNLFVLGIAGGAAARWYWRGEAPQRPVAGMAIPAMIRALPPERREEATALMHRFGDGMRERRRAAREARREAAELLRKEDFDPDAFAAAMANSRMLMLEAVSESHRMLAELAGTLTHEERQKLVEAWERRQRGRNRRERLRDGGSPPPPHE